MDDLTDISFASSCLAVLGISARLYFRFFLFIKKNIYISSFKFPWIDVILVVFILFKGRNGLENLTNNPTLYVKEWQQQKQVVRRERTRKL